MEYLNVLNPTIKCLIGVIVIFFGKKDIAYAVNNQTLHGMTEVFDIDVSFNN